MYLVSVYFDEKTDKRIKQYITQVAKKSGNTCMVDGNVPPHITISAFETKQEKKVIELLEKKVRDLKQGTVRWTSVGVFLPYVIYLAPVLNEYLYSLSEMIFECIKDVEDTSVSPFYRPLQWMPHTTVGKKLSKEEMNAAFQVLQNSFGVLNGQVIRIGIAKTNPYMDIAIWELSETVFCES